MFKLGCLVQDQLSTVIQANVPMQKYEISLLKLYQRKGRNNYQWFYSDITDAEEEYLLELNSRL